MKSRGTFLQLVRDHPIIRIRYTNPIILAFKKVLEILREPNVLPIHHDRANYMNGIPFTKREITNWIFLLK